GSWIKIDTTNGVRLGNNSTTKIQLDTSGNATFLAGNVTIADPNGISIAVSSSINNTFAYTFGTAFSGTNHVGVFNSESGSTRQVYLYDSTNQASKFVESSMFSSGASTIASLRVINDETGTPTPYVEVNTTLRPSVTNTIDLGQSSLAWNHA